MSGVITGDRKKKRPKPKARGSSGHRGGMKRDAEGLTKFERRFLDEYLKDLIGTEALRRAGYKHLGRLRQTAHEILHRPHVMAALDRAEAERHAKAEITQERLLEEYKRIALFNPQDIVQIDEHGNETIDLLQIPRDRAAAIAEFEGQVVTTKDKKTGKTTTRVVTRKVKPYNKLHALDKLGVHKGIFKEDFQVNVPVQFIIEGAPPMKKED